MSRIDASRLHLRLLAPADLAFVFELQSDPVSAAMAAIPVRDRAAFDAHWATLLDDASNRAWIVDYDGKPVGDLQSWLDGDHREIGYRVARAWWGRGVASGAVRLLLTVLPDRPLYARTAAGNGGSQRVLDRCGFVKTSEATAPDGVREWLYQLDR